MVQNRGIDVSVVSQFDIRRLPEFERPPHANTCGTNVVSCYIPVYPGSQIWFEYTVEPPHPPQAAYFFKLKINGQHVTAWDCTEKHGYHGKMAYLLEKLDQTEEYSGTSVQRRGFKFRNYECHDVPENDFSDYIEICVHRIEHRRRIYGILPDADRSLDEYCGERLQVISGGIIEPRRSLRRYKYQLVDPNDEPFATFRFFYRSYDFLKRNDIILTATSGGSSVSSATMWYDAPLISDEYITKDVKEENEVHACNKEPDSVDHLNSLGNKRSSITSSFRLSPIRVQRFSNDVFVPLSDSDGSLSVVVRDSIEDLRSNISRSSNSPRSRRPRIEHDNQASESPTRQSSSPRTKLKNRLALDLKELPTEPNRVRRPLSPFTSGGLLRCLVNSESSITDQSTTAQVTSRLLDNEKLQAESRSTEARQNGAHSSASSATNYSTGKSLIRRLSRRIRRRE